MAKPDTLPPGGGEERCPVACPGMVGGATRPGGRGGRIPQRASGRRRSPALFALMMVTAGVAVAACASPGKTVSIPGIRSTGIHLDSPTLLPRASTLPPLSIPITASDPTGTRGPPPSPAEGHRSATAAPGVTASIRSGFYRAPSPLPVAPPGSVIRSQIIAPDDRLPGGASAYRVVYDSESAGGTEVAVSGMVVVPGGPPPPGGFPIVSWAHGTTGLAPSCAPSLEGPASIPYLAPLLDHRMIVVATDYPGLGTPGPDSYLVGKSEAQAVLDAARAARNLVGASASNSVVVLGYSQGGQAALFAGQIAPMYAPELFVAGVVAVAPVTSIDELAPTVPGTGTDPDAAFALMAIASWSAQYGGPATGEVLAQVARRAEPLVTSACSGAVVTALEGTAADRLFRRGWSENPALRSDDLVNQPGGAPSSAPLLVVQGSEDDAVSPGATSRFVAASLCQGEDDTVRYVTIAGAGHQGALTESEPLVVRWISGRISGAPTEDTCHRND